MSKPRDYERLCHMRDFSRKLVELTKGKSRSDLNTNEIFFLAITRLLEIIGEAAKNVSPELCERYPEMPWSSIIGARDRLAHGYMKINLDIIWAIVTKDLPPLIAQLETLLKSEYGNAG